MSPQNIAVVTMKDRKTFIKVFQKNNMDKYAETIGQIIKFPKRYKAMGAPQRVSAAVLSSYCVDPCFWRLALLRADVVITKSVENRGDSSAVMDIVRCTRAA